MDLQGHGYSEGARATAFKHKDLDVNIGPVSTSNHTGMTSIILAYLRYKTKKLEVLFKFQPAHQKVTNSTTPQKYGEKREGSSVFV